MRKKYFDKLSKILVVIGMIFSICFSAENISVNAWDGNIPHEFTKVKIDNVSRVVEAKMSSDHQTMVNLYV